MTEAEWLACTNPRAMLDFLHAKATDRKMRLFACACCRRVWRLLIDERSREGIEAAERFIDGQTGAGALDAARLAARAAEHDVQRSPGAPASVKRAAKAAGEAAACALMVAGEYQPNAWIYGAEGVVYFAQCAVGEAERGPQADLLRDLLGVIPFRPAVASHAWLAWNDGAIPKMAKVVYDERAFDRLPLLADALEDAGCTDADLLAHLRGPGPHALGCWALDLLLGRT